MTAIKWEMTANRWNIRMGFQDSLNEVREKERKTERMTEGSERERTRVT
jgi:hypothetical protein